MVTGWKSEEGTSIEIKRCTTSCSFVQASGDKKSPKKKTKKENLELLCFFVPTHGDGAERHRKRKFIFSHGAADDHCKLLGHFEASLCMKGRDRLKNRLQNNKPRNEKLFFFFLSLSWWHNYGDESWSFQAEDKETVWAADAAIEGSVTNYL